LKEKYQKPNPNPFSREDAPVPENPNQKRKIPFQNESNSDEAPPMKSN
jgi:hypothetical protein